MESCSLVCLRQSTGHVWESMNKKTTPLVPRHLLVSEEFVKLSISTSKKCKGACKLDLDHVYCIGCGRTVEEIKLAYEKKKQEREFQIYWSRLPA